MHEESTPDPSVEYVPAEHWVGVSVSKRQYFPAGQSVQKESTPVPGEEYDPAEHDCGVDVPEVQYFPPGH